MPGWQAGTLGGHCSTSASKRTNSPANLSTPLPAYFVFAIGNLKPLFQAAYPQCPNPLPANYNRADCVCWSKTSSGVCNVNYSVSDTLT